MLQKKFKAASKPKMSTLQVPSECNRVLVLVGRAYKVVPIWAIYNLDS